MLREVLINGCNFIWKFLSIGLICLLMACSDQEPKTPPPPELSVVKVIQRDQPIQVNMVGETRGSSDVPIRARVNGFLEAVSFVEGSDVNKGDLLYKIDEVPYQTEVLKAKGILAEATTLLAKTKSDLERIRPLAKMNAVSQMDLDAAVAQYEAAVGGMQSAEAQVKQAEIQLSYCRIHAPIDGRIGISEVEVGEYVGGGNGLLNLISQVDPIRVRFSVDEKVYLKLARRMLASSKVDKTRHSRGAIELQLILADGSQHSHTGQVVTTGATIDSSTGTFTVEADFPNPDRLVLAGQYARIRGVLEVRKNALLVPQRALIERQGGFSLFVVDSQGKVEQRKVAIGPKINKLQIILEGLKASDKIVLEGIQKIRNGMTIVPKLTTFEEKANQASSQKMEG